MGKINNPNGKKGGDEHQEMIKQIIEQIDGSIDDQSGKKIEARKEYPISTPSGKKTLRIVDVAGLIETEERKKLVYLAQAGLTDKSGKPVLREQESIEDVEKETKIHVNFYDYKTQNKIR